MTETHIGVLVVIKRKEKKATRYDHWMVSVTNFA